jgi:hypothetical protein
VVRGGRELGLQRGCDLSVLRADRGGIGCSKIVRTRVDTQGWADFGTRVSRFLA